MIREFNISKGQSEFDKKKNLTLLGLSTRCHWVSHKTGQTSTRWAVINYSTLGIQTANARAGIFALVVHTSFAPVTIGINYTLRSATCIRITEIFGQTCTWACSIAFFANCVCPTRRRIAWVPRSLSWWNCNRRKKRKMLTEKEKCALQG